MMKFLLLALVVSTLVGTSYATYGLDVSTRIDAADFKCLKGRGFDFAIVRGFQSTGYVDPNACATIKDAWSYMAHVDTYLFPHPSGNPESQIEELHSHLSSCGARYGMIWIDIEAPSLWGSKSANVAFVDKMIKKGLALGINVGIYTSKYMWEEIMGSSTVGSSRPLWYPHYDDSPSFSDFTSFGGWHKPAIKQYKGTTTECSCGIDKNFY